MPDLNKNKTKTCYEFVKSSNNGTSYYDSWKGGIYKQVLEKLKSEDDLFIRLWDMPDYKYAYCNFDVYSRFMDSHDGEYIFSTVPCDVYLIVDERDFNIAQVINWFPVHYNNNIDFGYDIK